jgi:TRAP-type C4-dicarboxylate transport system permease small subunit
LSTYRIKTTTVKILQRLAKLCAILAGLLLIFITLMTVISVVGRETIGQTIVGDFELSGAAAGAAIALFMPWCQFRRGNIMVDFFTTRASSSTQNWMDRLGALVLACIMALMAWRTTLGGLNAWVTHSGSQIMDFPDWIVYATMVAPLALTVLIALHQAIFGFSSPSAQDNPALAV